MSMGGNPFRLRETLKETWTKCEVLQPTKLYGGRIADPGETVEMSLDMAQLRERQGRVRIVGEPYLHDTGIRIQDPPPPARRASIW